MPGARRLLPRLAWLAFLLAHGPRHASAAGGPNEVLPLVQDAWSEPRMCQPNAWVDYAVAIDKAGTNANWLFELEDLNAETEGYKTDALSLHLFQHAIPIDRVSGVFASQAKNRLYTLEVSYYDIKEDTYYVGVRCGITPTTFRVLARSVVAPFVENRPLGGEACSDQLVYHKFEPPPSAAVAFVDVTASADGADTPLHVMQHADTAPLRLRPPYESAAPGGTATTRVCWLAAGHAYYVALKTAAGCVPYTVTLSFSSSPSDIAACYHDESGAVQRSHLVQHLPELEHNHFRYDTGVPLSYMDFKVHVGDADSDDNLVVFVEDLTTGAIDPRAFGLYVYMEGEIPVDRHTEHKSEYSVDGEYTITINKWDLKKGDYIVSVFTSHHAKSFRIVPYFIHSGIKPGGHVAGFVCPGQLLFHYVSIEGHEHRRAAVDAPAVDGPVDVVFNLTVATGDMYYLTRHVYPPLKLAPPFQHANSYDGVDSNYTARICHAEPGRQYIGLAGGAHCSEYEIYVDLIPAENDCTEMTHMCTKDCDVSCKPIWLHHFSYDSCTPGEYKDFMLTVAEEDAMSNLIFQVDNLAREVRPEALAVYLYRDEIPMDRESQDKEEFSADGTWSVVVSEWDLKPARYYLSVKCTGDEPVKFRVLGELSHSNLVPGERVNGEVGPGSWAHYHYDVPESATLPFRIEFLIQLFTGDVKLRTQADYPPIKLIPPFHVTSVSEHRSGGPYEDVPMAVMACTTPGHTVYVGVLGGEHFARFQMGVVATPVEDASLCKGELHRRRLGGAQNAAAPSDTDHAVDDHAGHGHGSGNAHGPIAKPIEPQHFMKASCEPNEWIDFVLPHDSSRQDCNVVIEAEDLSRGFTQHGLGLFVYRNAIPEDRVTEFKSLDTPDGRYSVTINAWDFDSEVDYYVGVRCGSDAARNFRLLVEIVKGEVDEGTHAVGAACPGAFVYHFFDASAPHRRAGAPAPLGYGNETHTDVRFELVLHGGAVAYKTMHNEPPLKLVAPYRTTGDLSTVVFLCDVVHGRHYVGLTGLGACADYELFVHTMSHQDGCVEPEHDPAAAGTLNSHEIEELSPSHFAYGSCEPHEVKDFVLRVSYEMSKTNLVIDVSSLDEETRNEALEVSLYEYEIPASRETEHRETFAPEGMWTLTRSYHDMHAGDYYVSVRCMDIATSFRVLPLLIPAQLTPVERGGHAVHGEICPGDWVYHVVDVSDVILGGELHDTSLDATLAFDVELHSGDFYYMLRATDPPIRLTPPYRLAKLNGTEAQRVFHVCEGGIALATHSRYYLALRGGEYCADYAISATLAASCTEPFTHDSSTHVDQNGAAIGLWEGHFVYGSCEPRSLQTFSLHVDEAGGGAVAGYVFDVEDITGLKRPSVLRIVLAQELNDGQGSTELIDEADTSVNGIYRANLSPGKVVAAANYTLVVQCADQHVRFRVSANSASVTRARLAVPDHVPHQVAPQDWSIHSVLVQDPSAYEIKAPAGSNSRALKFSVRMFSGRIHMAMMRKGRPPGFSTLRSNYYHRSVEGEAAFEITICDPVPGTEYFLALYGGAAPAEYEVATSWTFSEAPCTVPEHDKGYVWRFLRDAPTTNEASITNFLGWALLVLSVLVLFYIVAAVQESYVNVNEKRERTLRSPDDVVHSEMSISTSTGSAKYLKSGLSMGAAAHAEAEEMVALELDKRFGEGKGKHLLSLSKKMGVRRVRAQAELAERSMRKMAYKALGLYLFVTFLFLCILQLQRDISKMNRLESSMRAYVSQAVTPAGVDFEELSSYEEVFDWLEFGFIASFFPPERWYNGDKLPEEKQGFLRLYNKKLSGFVLKQRRVAPNAGIQCEASKRFRAFTPYCYGELDEKGTETSEPFGPPTDPTKYTSVGGHFAVHFPLNRKEAIATIHELRDDLFIDLQTRSLQLTVTIYNPAYRLFCITTISMDIRSTGSIYKSITFETFPIELYVTTLDVFRGFFEISFVLFTLASLAYEIFEFVAITREDDGWHIKISWREYFGSFANYLDLARQAMWQMSIFWYIRIVSNKAAIELKLPLPEGQIDAGLKEVAALWYTYAQLNAVSVLVCLCTVFRFLNLSPQYGTLVRTITRAAPSLLKFGLMFALIFAFFAVMGQLMFGTTLSEWSTIWDSVQVLFQMMTGEYGFEPLLEADPIMAPIFYYSYLIIIFFLLLNILLAILMDTYAIITEELQITEERENSRHSHSVVREIWYEVLQSFKQLFARVHMAFFDSTIAVPAYLTSERGLRMVVEDGNEDMVKNAFKLKLEELDADLEAVRDEDGMEDLFTYELLTKYYSEMSAVLLLLSVGDPLSKIYEESARVLDPGSLGKNNRTGRDDDTFTRKARTLRAATIVAETAAELARSSSQNAGAGRSGLTALFRQRTFARNGSIGEYPDNWENLDAAHVAAFAAKAEAKESEALAAIMQKRQVREREVKAEAGVEATSRRREEPMSPSAPLYRSPTSSAGGRTPSFGPEGPNGSAGEAYHSFKFVV